MTDDDFVMPENYQRQKNCRNILVLWQEGGRNISNQRYLYDFLHDQGDILYLFKE